MAVVKSDAHQRSRNRSRDFLAFIGSNHVNRAAQYHLGVKASDVYRLPPLASDWAFESPNLNNQCVIQPENSEHRIFEN
jgi:hypothetical protein